MLVEPAGTPSIRSARSDMLVEESRSMIGLRQESDVGNADSAPTEPCSYAMNRFYRHLAPMEPLCFLTVLHCHKLPLLGVS